MADIVYLLLTVAFFGLCVLYVRGLDRIVQAAEDADATHEGAATAAIQLDEVAS
jgi:hypothetical protein